jgi:hypothetical protein
VDASEFLERVKGCRDWVLAGAAAHEQAANYGAYIHDQANESYDRREQKKLLEWVEALDMILSERPYLGQ